MEDKEKLMFVTRDVQMAVTHDIIMVKKTSDFKMQGTLTNNNTFTFTIRGKAYKVTVDVE